MGWDVNCAATATCDACGKEETYPVFDKQGTHFPYPDIDFFREYGWDENEEGHFLCADCAASGRVVESTQEEVEEDKRMIFDRVHDGSRHGKGTRRKLITIQSELVKKGVPCEIVSGVVQITVGRQQHKLIPLGWLGERLENVPDTEIVNWMELVSSASESVLPLIKPVLQRMGYHFRLGTEEE